MEQKLPYRLAEGQAQARKPVEDAAPPVAPNLEDIDSEYQGIAEKLGESQTVIAGLRQALRQAQMAQSAQQSGSVEPPPFAPGSIKGSVWECRRNLKLVRASFKSFAKAVLRRLLREASARLPIRMHPSLIVRGISNDSRIDARLLLPSTSSPCSTFALTGPAAAFTYAFASGVSNLSEVVLFLAGDEGCSASSVTVSISKGGATLREVVIPPSDVNLMGATVARFAPIEDSLGGRFKVSVVAPNSSKDDPIFVKLFGSARLLPPPWVSQQELALYECGGGHRTCFLPCFRAEVSLSDFGASVSWAGAPETLEYVPLYGDRVVRFTFEAPVSEVLTRIQVTFGSYRRVNHIPIRLSVEGGGAGWSGEFSGALIPDNALFALPIPRSVLAQLKGSRVTVSLSAPHALADAHVAVMGNPIRAANSGCDYPEDQMVQRHEVVGNPYSALATVPTFRRAFLGYPHARPLAINIVLSEKFCPWWMRRFARDLADSFIELGHHSTVVVSPKSVDGIDVLRSSDILLVCAQSYSNELRDLITDVRASYGVVIAFQPPPRSLALGDEGSSEPVPFADCSDMVAACSMMMAIGEEQKVRLEQRYALPIVTSPFQASRDDSQCLIDSVVDLHKSRYLPKVSIVTVLYRKEREIPYFLKAIADQDYPGELELVVVDDQSPDRSKAALKDAYDSLLREGARLPALSIIENTSNLGNCGSRNEALKAVSGEIVVVVDCDCLLNRSFISAHVYSHLFHDASVVTGPCNLETGAAEPMDALENFEQHRSRVMSEALLQDSVNLDSFVNCITRNFSIQRSALSEDLFDEQFGYSAHPDSGFGWEDVEMGYRLFKRGLRIHFTHDAFSVHISHLSTTDDGVKPLKSFKNFRRLLEKHPGIKDEARRWCLETFAKIEEWSAGQGHGISDDQEQIQRFLGRMYPYPFAISRNRKLRVLTYRWHVPHQYELYKLPHEFTLLPDLGTGFTGGWEFEQRPQPKNATFKPRHQVRVSDFDLAIIHFDENVLSPENCNRVIGHDWGANFRYFVEQISGIPKVAICHGTPQFVGQYRPDYHESDLGMPIEESRELLVNYLRDIPVVCNSHQAAREWGFKRSQVIWHGFDPSEFTSTDYSGGILSLGRSMRERPHYRGYEHFKRVSALLPEEFRPSFHNVPRPPLYSVGQEIYPRLKFEVYKQSLRNHSVYFNPTLRSPMPRSRGEAMMSGLVSVSAANHDVQLFIKNGWNGFYSDSSEEMADYLLFLMRNKKACREIGVRSRATAADVFNHDRYLHAWQSLIHEVVGG